MNRLTQDELEAAVLAYLFQHADTGLGKVSVMLIAGALDAPVARTNFAVQALERQRYVKSSHSSTTGSLYEISEEGYRSLERLSITRDELEDAKARTGEISVNTSSWTGLPTQFELNEAKRAKLVRELDTAESVIADLQLTQEVSAQVRSYVVAAKILAEAPEPPADLIWEIINRANAVAGVASLFVSLLALFH